MDNNNKNKDPNHNRQGWGIILVTTLLVTFMVMGLYSMMRGSGPEQISYDKFLSLIDEGEVQEVNLYSDRIYITLTDEARQKEFKKSGQTGIPENVWSQLQEQMQSDSSTGEESERDPDYYTGYVNDYTLTDKLEEAGVKFGSEPADTVGQTLLELFITVILPIGLMAGMLIWLMRKMTKGGGVMGIGKRSEERRVGKECRSRWSPYH